MAQIARHDTQWAAQCASAYELARRGYRFAFTLGNEPRSDLRVTSPGGVHFEVQVKGQQRAMARAGSDWYIQEPPPDDPILYMLVAVPTDHRDKVHAPRIFIMTGNEIRQAMHAYLEDRRRRGTSPERWQPAIRWKDAEPYQDHWQRLPA
jgi:hypothetical protein